MPIISIDLKQMEQNADVASQLLKSLSNGHRLMILCLLLEKEMTVGELNERVPLSQSALSQHLALLRKQGLVTTRKLAQQVWYSLASKEAEAILMTLHGLYCDEG